MADTTVVRIRDTDTTSLFWWLKISGLPYYFFQRIDPTSATFGSAKWTLGTGFTAKLALDTPSGTFTQTLPDLVGGLASPERITLDVNDFELFDDDGKYRFFGRLRAPGRAKTAIGPKWGYLNSDLLESATVGEYVYLRGPQGFAASGELYCPGETIGYSARTEDLGSTGQTRFTIAARNKYPCVDHGGGFVWPVQRPISVPRDATGNVLASSAVIMYSQPFTLLGRRMALYCGYLNVDGTPCAEAKGLCRFVGRIKSVSRENSVYKLGCESILADLTSAKFAPQLAQSSLEHGQIHIPNVTRYNTFIFGVERTDSNGYRSARESAITIPAGVYGYGSGQNGILVAIQEKIREAILSVDYGLVTFLGTKTSQTLIQNLVLDGEVRCMLRLFPRHVTELDDDDNATVGFYIRHGQNTKSYLDDKDMTDATTMQSQNNQSLLCAIGFPPGDTIWHSQNSPSNVAPGLVGSIDGQSGSVIVSPGVPPWIFIPTVGLQFNVVRLATSNTPGSRMFTDQLDGSGKAWARLSDGQIVEVIATTESTITLGGRADLSAIWTGANGQWVGAPPAAAGAGFYALPINTEGHIEQVLVLPSPGTAIENPVTTARNLLAAGGGEPDAYFPAGIGLGWYQLMDFTTWNIHVQNLGARRFVIDSNTQWSDFFTAILKEYGLFVLWDCEQGQIVIRRLRMPGAGADVSYALTESNRSKRDDISQEEEDFSNIRTGWSIKSGWDQAQGKFSGQTYTITDFFPISAYGASLKLEEIGDRSIMSTQSIGQVLTALLNARSPFVQSPWNKVQRTINKRLSLMSPGMIVGPLVDLHATSPKGDDGFTADDNVYGLLYSVSTNPETGEGHATVLINTTTPAAAWRKIAPAALVDIDKADGGYGYGFKQISSGVIRLWFKRHYTQAAGSTFDGIDFQVGDECRITRRDNRGAAVSFTATITVVDTLGQWAEMNSAMEVSDIIASITSELVLVWADFDASSLDQQDRGTFAVSGEDLSAAGATVGLWL